MERIVFTSLAVAVFCGVAVSGACDNSTAAKIVQCVFSSDLYKPNTMQNLATDINSYCGANATVNCVQTQRGSCTGNDRQLKLMDNLITYQHVVEGNANLCNETVREAQATEHDCYNKLKSQETMACIGNAVGSLENQGDVTDVKEKLDNMCTFFTTYTNCFPAECSYFKEAAHGVAFHYCMLNDAERQKVVTEYETGVSGAPIYTLNVLSIIAAILAVLYL